MSGKDKDLSGSTVKVPENKVKCVLMFLPFLSFFSPHLATIMIPTTFAIIITTIKKNKDNMNINNDKG